MAQEIRTRVAAAEEHARLDAEQVRYSKFTVASAHSSSHTNLTPCIWNEQRHSEERSALRAEKHAAVSVARQQVEAELGEKLVLQVSLSLYLSLCVCVCVSVCVCLSLSLSDTHTHTGAAGEVGS